MFLFHTLENKWKYILKKSNRMNFFQVSDNNTIVEVCNKEVFSLIWSPVIGALSAGKFSIYLQSFTTIPSVQFYQRQGNNR